MLVLHGGVDVWKSVVRYYPSIQHSYLLNICPLTVINLTAYSMLCLPSHMLHSHHVFSVCVPGCQMFVAVDSVETVS